MGKKKQNIDWFARIIAIAGLLIALVAVFVPYYQNINNNKEKLNISAMAESGDAIIRLSADVTQSKAVQIPYIVTLSNSSNVDLSIRSHVLRQIIDKGGVLMFAGLDGGLTTSDNKVFQYPINLEAGKSVSFRLYVGYLPTDDIQQKLKQIYHENNKKVTVYNAFISLAKDGLTLYGGKAVLKEYEGGSRSISIDPSFYSIEPLYSLVFLSGRGNDFNHVFSENFSRMRAIEEQSK